MTVLRQIGRWMARAARRLCTVRHCFALAAGGALTLLPLISAGPASSSVALLPYAPEYPHRAYAYQLALTRLQENAAARDWLAAADRALLGPDTVKLPFVASSELAADRAAAGYAFDVAAGRRLTITVRSALATDDLFVDVFRAEGARHERVAGTIPRSALQPISIDVLEDGEYVLRVQPPLGTRAPYEVELATRALLGFPVEGVDQRAIWSGFGADRDGGRRAHRGVDIFAARGTPALAATDGWVTRVETTRRGGNVVWLQPLFGNMRLYYAHLDEQWVSAGDFVVAGQPLGAVGNTGNAVTTPPHLHFGVYVRRAGVRGGARDPADFLR